MSYIATKNIKCSRQFQQNEILEALDKSFNKQQIYCEVITKNDKLIYVFKTKGLILGRFIKFKSLVSIRIIDNNIKVMLETSKHFGFQMWFHILLGFAFPPLWLTAIIGYWENNRQLEDITTGVLDNLEFTLG